MFKDQSTKNNNSYEKLFIVWFFDDEEGYGIEVMGLTQEKRFTVVTTWTFGKGTEARDLRKAWGEYISDLAFQQKSKLEPEILKIKLRYDFNHNQLNGDLAEIKKLLAKREVLSNE